MVLFKRMTGRIKLKSHSRSKDTKSAKAMTLEKESDVEQLCKIIYDNGEQYMDGTAAINFAALKIVRS